MFLLNGKPLPLDTPFTANDIQYPANWLRLASQEDKEAIGIMEVADPVRADDRLYWNGDINNPKALEDKLEEDGSTTKGLKSQLISQVKQTANLMLSQSDWVIIRNYERGVEIPSEIAQERASILQALDSAELAINQAATVEELASVNLSINLVQNP